jgi:hypothetical protein
MMNQYIIIEGVEKTTIIENHPQHRVSPKKYAKPSNKLGFFFFEEIMQGTSNFPPSVM